MTEKERPPKNPIPEFTSREEEAAFWDTHSLADYWDEFKPSEVTFARNLSENLTIRLDEDTLKLLRLMAHDKGLRPTTMIRMWVIERLKQETRPSP